MVTVGIDLFKSFVLMVAVEKVKYFNHISFYYLSLVSYLLPKILILWLVEPSVYAVGLYWEGGEREGILRIMNYIFEKLILQMKGFAVVL